ncbi:haloacid dehalogenase-like hydrolase domain-containing protein At2g33255 [Momordica charantia]|uniref:Haloacid dehalogenase-like hydrolase domain-containing protein At2g33255 n=1 Tax=Momordica charantia TaxID=3673 RepID=A0A6J1DUJ7_MOMCH|nr:haloacid dehalogenase-like hydrolase domain-containing protein At2g33255 [Momordica charantia]
MGLSSAIAWMNLSPILNPKFRAPGRGRNRILFLATAFATIHPTLSPHHPCHRHYHSHYSPVRCLFPTPMANFSSAVSPRRRLRGVVFDMDGTLTVPVIDFAAMYKSVLGHDEHDRIRAQNPSGIDILHIIQNWAPDKQRRAYEVIADFERQGLDRLRIMPGAAELCAFLDSKKIRTGLITRNIKEAVDLFHQRFGRTFYPALSREFGSYKPNPAPLLHICSSWDVLPNEVIMVGDSLRDDVGCGKQAGAFTCLLDETGRYNPADYANLDLEPDFKVSSLDEVRHLLDAEFDLAP